MSILGLVLCFLVGYIFRDFFKFLLIVGAGIAFFYYYQGLVPLDLFNVLVKLIDTLKELAI